MAVGTYQVFCAMESRGSQQPDKFGHNTQVRGVTLSWWQTCLGANLPPFSTKKCVSFPAGISTELCHK